MLIVLMPYFVGANYVVITDSKRVPMSDHQSIADNFITIRPS